MPCSCLMSNDLIFRRMFLWTCFLFDLYTPTPHHKGTYPNELFKPGHGEDKQKDCILPVFSHTMVPKHLPTYNPVIFVNSNGLYHFTFARCQQLARHWLEQRESVSAWGARGQFSCSLPSVSSLCPVFVFEVKQSLGLRI